MPTTTTAIRLVTAQPGMCAVSITYTISTITATRSKTRCAKTVPSRRAQAPVLAHAPVEHRDSCQLADPTGQDRVCEEADGKGGEDEHEARMRWFERLHDHRAPGQRTKRPPTAGSGRPRRRPSATGLRRTRRRPRPTPARATRAPRTPPRRRARRVPPAPSRYEGRLTTRRSPVRRSRRAACRCRPRSNARPRRGALLHRAPRGAARPPAGRRQPP